MGAGTVRRRPPLGGRGLPAPVGPPRAGPADRRPGGGPGATKMMAEQRRIARTRGKSDPIDAAAVARAALREPGLPIASHDDTSRELRLLVDRREDLVKTRTATINRLLWRGHARDPRCAPPPPAWATGQRPQRPPAP